jgi:hypothetical protein
MQCNFKSCTPLVGAASGRLIAKPRSHSGLARKSRLLEPASVSVQPLPLLSPREPAHRDDEPPVLSAIQFCHDTRGCLMRAEANDAQRWFCSATPCSAQCWQSTGTRTRVRTRARAHTCTGLSQESCVRIMLHDRSLERIRAVAHCLAACDGLRGGMPGLKACPTAPRMAHGTQTGSRAVPGFPTYMAAR